MPTKKLLRTNVEKRSGIGAKQGHDIALTHALPGSASQLYDERQGFRFAYTRIKWQLRQSVA
ncbi:MAG: hypothetical protein AB1757_23940 [Acidobacteriota bacterium]